MSGKRQLSWPWSVAVDSGDRPSRLAALRQAIEQAEERLERLEAERREASLGLAELRAELAALDGAPETASVPFLDASDEVPKTPDEKIRLFRSLFRGRSDVFPLRFVSQRTGKAGYAPACRNKFVPDLCGLPRVKCGECPNQAFLPFDDSAVLGHLTGRHVIGVYPLLKDETCWLLAVDFDRTTWAEDVEAFSETCRRTGLPVAIERSRSGNGAHVWLFFAAPVPASAARALGCHLLTETLSRRPEIGMESYDRFFPSQDTQPRGGFGNLIALPLQRNARLDGNSIFLDEQLRPIPDEAQWTYLAAVRRIDPGVVERIVREANRTGSVLGVRSAGEGFGDHEMPWFRRSRDPRARRIADPLPRRVVAVLAQRLFVEKVGLPSAMIHLSQRLAAFQNPEFYKRQSLRFSTAATPRIIACAHDLPRHIALPRGCQPELEGLLREYEIELELIDERNQGEPVALAFHGVLTPTQERAAKALLAHELGVLVAPPGFGKTVIGSWLIAARQRSTLVLVHRRPLLDQWVTQLAMFLNLEEKEIGRIGGGKRTRNGRLDVAMIQSVVRRGRVAEAVADYDQVVVDECHHLPAVSFESVLAEARARYVVGLTATPQRRDGHHPITEMQLGPVRFAINPGSADRAGPFTRQLVVRRTGVRLAEADETLPIQRLYAVLAVNEERNALILDDVIQSLEQGRSPILLTERKDHLEHLAGKLKGFARHIIVLRGGMGAHERRDAMSLLAAIPEDEERVVLATGRFAGEGFDDARLDTLFLTLPVSWKGTLIQYAGRLHRPHPAKREVRIFDYVDQGVPMLERMFQKRLRGYRAIGYASQPLDEIGRPPAELTVEYDEEPTS